MFSAHLALQAAEVSAAARRGHQASGADLLPRIPRWRQPDVASKRDAERTLAAIIFCGRAAMRVNDPVDLTDREAARAWGQDHRSHMIGSGQRSVTR